MLNRIYIFFALIMGLSAYAQECPDMVFPADGATNVPLNATIDWESVDGVPSYNITLGTTPGGDDILSSQFASGSSYTPPLGLPANTTIYVTITLFFFNQPNITCPSTTFTTEPLTAIPNCTQVTNPPDMAIDVNPNTAISWDYVYGATGYLLSLGTSPGGTELLNNLDVGNTLSHNPSVELPPQTTIYATVTPYNILGVAAGCSFQQFTTREASAIPDCTTIIYPQNGETNVPLSPVLEWFAVPGATGYVVTIGTTPTGTDILNGAVFNTNSTPVVNFEPNKTFFITIVPFNDAGQAEGCVQTSFTTLLGCGPYLDFQSGEYITINPVIDFPDTFSSCENEGPLVITSDDVAEGYRWYQIDQFGNENLLSSTNEVTLTENGTYRYEAYNTIVQNGNFIECPSYQVFEVLSSEQPTIDNIVTRRTGQSLQLTIIASGNGDYEYAIDNINGPYSDSNVFTNVALGNHTIYVRDKNGCGITERLFTQDLTVEGFPKFFTPNGDTINDYWQFIQPRGSDPIIFQSIRIFDRFGMFLKQISQDSQGWDGTVRGNRLPSGDYWFLAIDEDNREFRGHFTLKR
ncbi:T9SS type B sorting domain-containing protein [Flagellimonas marinaquae]|uniref:T9SS type B sorting domain-containing protein n=1 Tax=Flagellimonas marinaquae TaxID=254955 RepID=UPI000F8D10BD|nr:T9SS type B sorting domain-containing protein [Allomuricauda aquimarina]